MFGTAIIVFREMLEAAIIIGIISAATREVPGRNRWIYLGLAAGLLGSLAVAGFTERISEWADGIGQELFNALVLGFAVVMLAWHNIWMSSHGAELAAHAKKVSTSIHDGREECSVLLLIVGLAVLREGSETVLFLYGMVTSQNISTFSLAIGGLAGVLAGGLVGYALYAGLLRIPLRWFFGATSLLVLLLASGMASQAAHYLIQADMLPSLASPLWDTSSALSEQSVGGKLLHSLIGYESHPAGMQVVFYCATFILISLGMKMTGLSNSKSSSGKAS